MRLFSQQLQRIAAILLLPVLVYAGFLSVLNWKNVNQPVAILSVQARKGMQSEVELPDGTKVWLNAGARIDYPQKFDKSFREVTIHGEAYFDVAHNSKCPFVVQTRTLNVEVLGTKFNIINDSLEKHLEVVLTSGKVSLFTGAYKDKATLGEMKPGQRAVYDQGKNKVSVSNVEVDKYIAWKDGVLMLREDRMPEMANRLGRWFNVKVVIKNPEINEYLITAKFKDETLSQIMDLIKLSSPIDYKIEKSKRTNDGNFTQTILYIDKKLK